MIYFMCPRRKGSIQGDAISFSMNPGNLYMEECIFFLFFPFFFSSLLSNSPPFHMKIPSLILREKLKLLERVQSL